MEKTKIDKTKFKDAKGRYIVQGLFLEDRYDTNLAVFTYSGEDKLYNGVVYPSLKRLYLDFGDPEEYEFARTYLYDWPHWKRLTENAMIRPHIADWREELRLSLRSEGISQMIGLAKDGSYQAAKFLADEGWIKNPRGRPSQAEIDRKLKEQVKLEERFSEDFELLAKHQKNK